jgi:uncharacterized membrane protein
MTDEDKYALKELLCGIGVFLCASTFFIVGMITLAHFASGDKPIDFASFEVVDKYKECDVVRYAPQQVAEYKYFLYCEKNK